MGVNLKSLRLVYFVLFWLLFRIAFFPVFFFLLGPFFVRAFGLCFRVSVFKVSFWFFVSVCIISFLVVAWRFYYIGGGFNLFFFYFFLGLFVLSILMLVVRERFLVLFLGWEGLGVTSFLLVIFYQNWVRYGGGLLTMLTNRLGDGLLLIRLSYWSLLDLFFFQFQVSSMFLFLVFCVLSFTKSAQVPFIRWLPAAIAAPTPVSSLVHSSTLVTAGVWLIVRFGQKFLLSSFFWGFFGISTLLVASFAAMKEVDGKKVVALSTLRQLGLMFLSLSLGGKFVCLMHVLMHAFAKANLFLRVGRVLYFRFSQQDSRFLLSGLEEFSLFSSFFIRVLRLSGLAFYSGFFSKEIILLGEVTLVSGVFVIFLLLGVVVLTLSYCMLLFFYFSVGTFFGSLFIVYKSKFYSLPIFFIRVLTVFLGFFVSFNVFFRVLFLGRFSGFYWIFLLLRVVVLVFNFVFLLRFFSLQKKAIFSSVLWFGGFNKILDGFFCSLLEPFYLLVGVFSGSLLFSQFFRLRVLLLFLGVIGFFF